MECKRNGRVTEGQAVHHKRPWKDGDTPEEQEDLLWDLDNLEVVCNECHIKLHQAMRPINAEAELLDSLAIEYLGLDT